MTAESSGKVPNSSYFHRQSCAVVPVKESCLAIMSQLVTEILQLYSIGDSFYQRELAKLQRELDNFEENKFLAVIPLIVGFFLGILFLYVLRLVVRLLQSAMKMLKYSENVTSSSSTVVAELAKLPPLIPKHIAVIMDGNRRFGMQKHGDALQGHWAGGQTLVDFIQWCIQDGIEIATFFAFSTENWRRDPNEVQTLMAIFAKYAESLTTEATTRNVRVRVLSTDFEKLPMKVQDSIEVLERATAHCTGLLVNICLSYGSRAEILRACNAAVSEKLKAAMLKRKAARMLQQQQQQQRITEGGYSNGHSNGQTSRRNDSNDNSSTNGYNNGHQHFDHENNTDLPASSTTAVSSINNGVSSKMNGHHKLFSNQGGLGDKIETGLSGEGVLLCGKCGLIKPLSSTRSLPNGISMNGNSNSGNSSSGNSSSSVPLGTGLGIERDVGVQNGYEDRENGHNGQHNHSNSHNVLLCTCPHSYVFNQDLLSDPTLDRIQVPQTHLLCTPGIHSLHLSHNP